MVTNIQKTRYEIRGVIPLEQAIYECQRDVDNGNFGKSDQKSRVRIGYSSLSQANKEVLEQLASGEIPKSNYKERLKITLKDCLGHMSKIPGYFRRN